MGVDHYPTTGYSGPIHGELIVDGDGSTLTALTLYQSGTVTTVTLTGKMRLFVTDVFIMLESGGDFELIADGEVAGEYIAQGNAAANGGVQMSLRTAFRCQAATGVKFKGVATNRNVCIIEGYVRSA